MDLCAQHSSQHNERPLLETHALQTSKCIRFIHSHVSKKNVQGDAAVVAGLNVAEDELNAHLKHRKDVDRTLTGDGATKQRTPFINFLVNVPGKGTKLIDIIDCTDHLSTGQVKDAM